MDTAKAGTLLCVNNGEYSNFSVTGFFVVLREFTPMAELDEFHSNNKHKRGPDYFDSNAFLASLLAKGLLMEVAFRTFHLSDDHDFDTVTFD